MLRNDWEYQNDFTRRFLNVSFAESTLTSRDKFLKKLLQTFAFVGVVLHVCFALIFFTLDLPTLALVNVASIVIWITTYLLVNIKMFAIALFIMIAEIVAHAVIATLLLGTDAGFHYYILPALGMLLATPTPRKWVIFGLTGLLTICFIYLSVVFDGDGPLASYPVFQIVMLSLNVIFATGSFLIAIFYSEVRRTRSNKRFFQLAHIDEFTQLFNRRFVYKFLNQSHEKLNEYGINNFVVVFADVDDMRTINEHYGHAFGDDVILRISQVLKRHLREDDIIARWSGAEFLLAFTDVSIDEATNIIESIRFSIYNENIPINPPHKITLSFGIAASSPKQRFMETLQAADLNLFRAKSTGKDQYVTIDNANH